MINRLTIVCLLGMSGLLSSCADLPGQGENYPGQGGHYPGQGENYPGQGGYYPGQGRYYPGQGGYYPGQGDIIKKVKVVMRSESNWPR